MMLTNNACAQKVMPMPLRYEVIGHKAFEHGDSYITVFFILVNTHFCAQIMLDLCCIVFHNCALILCIHTAGHTICSSK
jgi:hypothetical protein